MSSLNVCMFTGNLGQDPEFNVATTGTSVCNINLAVSNYNSKDKANETMWLRVTFFGQQAEFLEKYANKGDKVAVTGALRLRKYTDREGTERQSVELLGNTVEIVHSAASTPAASRKADPDDFDPFLDSEDEEEQIATREAKAEGAPARGRANTRARR